MPIRSFAETAAELWATDMSWLDVRRTPRNGYNGSSQWVPIEKSPLIPKDCVCKSDQWICLTRRHAEKVVALPSHVGHADLWHAFRKGCASDEMYFATMLACVGVIPTRAEATTDESFIRIIEESGEVALRKMTHVQWIYPDLDDYSGSSTLADRPVTYNALTQAMIDAATSDGCIFIRKVKRCSMEEWEALVLVQAEEGRESDKMETEKELSNVASGSSDGGGGGGGGGGSSSSSSSSNSNSSSSADGGESSSGGPSGNISGKREGDIH